MTDWAAIIAAVGVGGVVTQICNFLLTRRQNEGDLTLKAWVQLKDEQAAWRAELIGNCERMEADMDKLRVENMRLHGKIAELERKNTDLHDENDKLRKRIEFLESQPGPSGAVVGL